MAARSWIRIQRTQCDDDAESKGQTLSSSTESNTPTSTPKQWHNLVAGGIAGAGSRIATAPLDLIRIRRQLQATTVVYPSESMWQSWQKIVRSEQGGVTALFRGNSAAISLWISYAAVQFAVYTPIRDSLKDREVPGAAFWSGAAAGVCATLATYPFDVCRTTFAARGLASSSTSQQQQQQTGKPIAMQTVPPPVGHHSMIEPAYPVSARQVSSSSSTTATAGTTAPPSVNTARPQPSSSPSPSPSPPRNMMQFAVQLWQAKGIRGFYAGTGPAVAQIIPYMGLNFWMWDTLTTGGGLASGTAGAISGAVSKLAIYPVDTVKRRLQAQAFFEEHRVSSTTTVDHRVWRTIKEIYQQGGWKSFYRGVFPSLLKTTIATSLSFSIFRLSKDALAEFG